MKTIEPVSTKPMNGGIQELYRFEDGFGASVVRGPYTYGGDKGLWELGVIRWDGGHFALTYETPITYDVLGYLDDGEVLELLGRIQALPKAGS